MENKCCANCSEFFQHYIKRETRFAALGFGHCNRKQKTQKTYYLCKNYSPIDEKLKKESENKIVRLLLSDILTKVTRLTEIYQESESDTE